MAPEDYADTVRQLEDILQGAPAMRRHATEADSETRGASRLAKNLEPVMHELGSRVPSKGARGMAMKRLLVMLTVVLSPTPAAAELSTERLLGMYPLANNEARLYFRGLIEGVEWMNTILDYQKRPKLYCVPTTITLTTEQALDIVRRLVEKEPESATFPAGMMLVKSLQKAFPCPP